MDTVTQEAPKLRRYNWWKIGFFVALFAFEVAREVAVLEGATPPQLMTSASVFSTGDWTVAEGRWRRIDSGEDLIPVLVRIECAKDRGECSEVTVNVHDNSVWSPDIGTYTAKFGEDAITYENRAPRCVDYTARIDLKLQKVIAVRQKKPKVSDCPHTEERIEMQLADGWDLSANNLEGHFVPLLNALKWLVRVF